MNTQDKISITADCITISTDDMEKYLSFIVDALNESTHDEVDDRSSQLISEFGL